MGLVLLATDGSPDRSLFTVTMNEAGPVSQGRGLRWTCLRPGAEPHAKGGRQVKDITKFVALDVHQDTIAVGVADARGGPGRYWGTIPHRVEAVRKLLEQLGPKEQLLVCYEAGPTGYGLHRLLTGWGVACIVVAPSLKPTRPGERVKTDRRDAVRLAELLRAGELPAAWVPGEEDEALRDLVRAREDAKQDLLRARHRLSKFLLRRGLRPPEGVRRWSRRYQEWLEGLQLEQPALQRVLREYVHAITEITERLRRLEEEIREQARFSVHAPVIQALQALRGVGEVVAVTAVAEVGWFSRFARASQLMAYAGIVPREYSSGARRRHGAITKTGNAHLRRVLVEAAWAYRHPPGLKAALRRRYEGQPPEVQQVAWKAQERLCRRYRRMTARGKPTGVAVTAVARELVGFMWALARIVERKQWAELPTV